MDRIDPQQRGLTDQSTHPGIATPSSRILVLRGEIECSPIGEPPLSQHLVWESNPPTVGGRVITQIALPLGSLNAMSAFHVALLTLGAFRSGPHGISSALQLGGRIVELPLRQQLNAQCARAGFPVCRPAVCSRSSARKYALVRSRRTSSRPRDSPGISNRFIEVSVPEPNVAEFVEWNHRPLPWR